MRRRTALTAVPTALLALVALACGGDVETETRSLASGRQIDVFRIFTLQGKSGVVLDYFYVSRYFDQKEEFEREWAEVVQDAQREADKQKATELMLVGSRRGAGLLSRLVRENERGRYFRKQGGSWVEEPSK